MLHGTCVDTRYRGLLYHTSPTAASYSSDDHTRDSLHSRYNMNMIIHDTRNAAHVGIVGLM